MGTKKKDKKGGHKPKKDYLRKCNDSTDSSDYDSSDSSDYDSSDYDSSDYDSSDSENDKCIQHGGGPVNEKVVNSVLINKYKHLQSINYIANFIKEKENKDSF